MVKTRNTSFGQKGIQAMDASINRFGKQMTHRKVTTTTDENGRITASSNSDATFKGDLQYGPKIDRMYATTGTIEVGNGILFISASETQNDLIEPKESVIIEGISAGAHDSWSVESLLDAPEIDGGVQVYKMFRVVRREQVTFS